MATLDLVELADLVRPEQLVDAIVEQNPELPLPIPIEELAKLAGISRIESFASEGFSGALVTNVEKSNGAIFYSSRDPRTRQRFTIGHELGHFLLPWHRQSQFNCKAQDLGFSTKSEWEIEANRFSAELLMPRTLVATELLNAGPPSLEQVTRLASSFETSLEMTARLYVELHSQPCAIVFSKDNVVRYSVRNKNFDTSLNLRKGDPLPHETENWHFKGPYSEKREIAARIWLKLAAGDTNVATPIFEQTLRQDYGFKITLLSQ